MLLRFAVLITGNCKYMTGIHVDWGVSPDTLNLPPTQCEKIVTSPPTPYSTKFHLIRPKGQKFCPPPAAFFWASMQSMGALEGL